MPASFPRRAVLALALVVALSLPSAMAASSLAAAGALPLRTLPAGSAALTLLWRWLAPWWPGNGCSADPDGRCLGGATVPPVHPQEGCSADPSGRCVGGATAPPVRPQDGCSADPDGRCGAAMASHLSRKAIGRP